jgi:hypothetical protein
MQPVRSPTQELETLDYLGDMLTEMARMAARDRHRLLSHLLYVASVEVDELKRIRGRVSPSDQTDDAA